MTKLFNCSAPLFPPMKMGVLIRPTSGGHCIKSFNTLCFRAMHSKRGFPGGSVVKKKNLPANAGDARSIPGLGGPREEGMATHSSVLAGRIPRTEEPWQATVYRVAKRHN